MLFTYTGLVVGSTLCTTLILVSESYQTAYTTMGALSIVAGLWVLLGRPASAHGKMTGPATPPPVEETR